MKRRLFSLFLWLKYEKTRFMKKKYFSFFVLLCLLTLTLNVTESSRNHCFAQSVPCDEETFAVNGVTFTMKLVEGGTFQMGATPEQGKDACNDEKLVHGVTLGSYYIGETEVTQALWNAVMGINQNDLNGDNMPMGGVSWNDCIEFVLKLNLLTNRNFRLPTEEEWEYAARGGKKGNGYKYSGSNSLDDVAWYNGNSNGKAHAVKEKYPNELGLYDMSGNVWEWCGDWYKSYNAQNFSDGSHRVLRGGSWGRSSEYCRVSSRYGSIPDNRLVSYGFRLCMYMYEEGEWQEQQVESSAEWFFRRTEVMPSVVFYFPDNYVFEKTDMNSHADDALKDYFDKGNIINKILLKGFTSPEQQENDKDISEAMCIAVEQDIREMLLQQDRVPNDMENIEFEVNGMGDDWEYFEELIEHSSLSVRDDIIWIIQNISKADIKTYLQLYPQLEDIYKILRRVEVYLL